MTVDTRSVVPLSCPEIGVCVLTYNSEEVLTNCIVALKDSLANVDYEIVVVDNDSHDESAAVAERQGERVKVIRNPVNSGYARGNNTGARQLLKDGCKYIAFVNPDVIVNSGTLTKLRNALDAQSDAGCAGCIAVVNGQAFAGSFRGRPTLAQKLWVYSGMRHLPHVGRWLKGMVEAMEASHFLPLSATHPVYALCGACIMFPARVFERVGGFDEHTFLYQEEFIISELLSAAGYKVYGVPDASYEHQQGHSAHVDSNRSRKCFIRSEQYYLREYYKCGAHLRFAVWLFRWADLATWMVLTVAKRRVRAFNANRRSESVS